jgi:hypothetical protein
MISGCSCTGREASDARHRGKVVIAVMMMMMMMMVMTSNPKP